MALDISKLARMCDFDMELNSLGRIRCLSLTTKDIAEAIGVLDKLETRSLDFSRTLITAIARKAVEGAEDSAQSISGPSLTAEEVSALSEDDLQVFSGNVVQKNAYLVSTHKGKQIEKAADETPCDFLVRAFLHYAAEQKAHWKRIAEPFSKSAFETSTLQSIARNRSASEKLRESIEKYSLGMPSSASAVLDSGVKMPRIHEVRFPENPILRTNEMLDDVVKQMENLRPVAAQCANLIQSMNDTALGMQADYVQNAKSSQSQTMIATWIAVGGLVLSVISLITSSVFSYRTYVDGKESGEKSEVLLKALETEINSAASARREDRDAIVKAIANLQKIDLSSASKR